MKHITIDSYGKCLHNKDFPFSDTRHEEGWGKRKIELMSQYLVHFHTFTNSEQFVLAFENSNTRDYVTEKLFHAFLAGAVPIVGVCNLV